MKKLLFIFLSFHFSFILFANQDDFRRRAQANLIIGDYAQAVDISEKGSQIYSDNFEMQKLFLHCLAAKGEENKLLLAYSKFKKTFPDQAYEKELLEEICWAILKKGRQSPSITIRLASLVGSALTGDIQGMRIILENLQESNCALRSLAIEFTPYYGDHALREEIERLFKQENSWELRLKVIKAVGTLRMESLQPALLFLIENEKSTLEEKVAAIIAIANMRQDIEREEIKVLASNKRSGLRMLACEAATKFQRKEDIDLILPLIDDERPEVRAIALKTLGLLGIKDFGTRPISFYLCNALKAYDPLVGITAAWVLLLSDQKAGEEALLKWIHHPNRDVAALASSVLKVSGRHGVPLSKKILSGKEDPFVKVNAAIALISQREQVFESCAFLFKFVQESKEYWMEDKEVNGLFSPIKLSNHKQNPNIPNYPEVINQTVRLEILNLIAMMQYPKAEQAIKQFLKERNMGITGLAAEMLLGEGDESALQMVRDLLTDCDRQVRIQAALVLAVWGHDHSAVPVLLESYSKVDRGMKIKILEALIRVGSVDSIPFLVDRLNEDSQILRILTASALVQTLNH